MTALRDTYQRDSGSRINRSVSPALLVTLLHPKGSKVRLYRLYRLNESAQTQTPGHTYTDLPALEADIATYVPGYDETAWQQYGGDQE
jgi:hypothetical protein